MSRLLKNEAPISLIILSYKGTLASELLPYGFLIERTTCSFENPQIHFEYNIDFAEIFEFEAQFVKPEQKKIWLLVSTGPNCSLELQTLKKCSLKNC